MTPLDRPSAARRLAFALAWLFACAGASADSSPRLATLIASGQSDEQLRWAQRFEHAEGVPRDYRAAVRLYCHAARAGLAEAQYRLGWMYANGRGVERDDALAAAWFKLAAAKGDRHAKRMLRRLSIAPSRARCRLPGGALYREPPRPHPTPSPTLVTNWVHALAPVYRLDPQLVLAVIRAESNFNHRAHSPKDARGLMQLLPSTAARFGVRDIWDPLQNVRGGMAYLRWLLDHFDGDETLALAGYNAGEAAVRRYNGIPPFPETRAYVRRVAIFKQRRAAPTSSGGAS